MAAQHFLTLAYAAADAGFVQPFDDLKLFSNIAVSWLVLRLSAPEGSYWLGMALILAGSAYLLWSERSSAAKTRCSPHRPLTNRAQAHQPAPMSRRPTRLAARALILHEDRLLLVNAYPGGRSDLWCAPGGGVESGHSLPDNLAREVHEETGLTIAVGAPALINEFHDPVTGLSSGRPVLSLHHHRRRRSTPPGATPKAWSPTAASFPAPTWNWAASASNPTACPQAAWGTGMLYDPLEVIVR